MKPTLDDDSDELPPVISRHERQRQERAAASQHLEKGSDGGVSGGEDQEHRHGPSHNIPQDLQALRKRAGVSLDEMAKSMGYSGASSIQRLFDPTKSKEFLSRDIVQRLESAVLNKGTPPIAKHEIWALAGPEFREIYESSPIETSKHFLALMGTVLQSGDTVLQAEISDFIEYRLSRSTRGRGK